MSRGKYTYGNPIVYTMAGQTTQQLYVGNFCSIGNNVSIYLDGNHNTNRVTTYPFGHIHKHVFESDGGGHPTSNGDVRIGNRHQTGMCGLEMMCGLGIIPPL